MFLIGYKDDKKLYLHAYFVQKLVYIEESLIKLDVCILLIKGEFFLINIVKDKLNGDLVCYKKSLKAKTS